jgi:hypothetical protein
LDEVDAMLKRGDRKEAQRFHRKELLGRSDEDRELLLHAANERWQMAARAPLTMSPPDDRELIMFALKNELVYPGLLEGMTIGAADMLARAMTWGAFGILPDVRDADTIAQQFLARADQLLALPGGEDVDAVLARARDEVIDGVPKGYRRKVVERILDREEEALRKAHAEAGEAAQIEHARDERRQHATRVLVEMRKPDGEGRGH